RAEPAASRDGRNVRVGCSPLPTNRRCCMRHARVLTVLSLLLLPVTSGAQTLPRFDQQIVVTPGRIESPLSRVPVFVTLLDEDDIAASPADGIPDLLRQAGVQVTDITGNGRSYNVDLRGFG